MANIRDIAKASGYSIATVSRVINKRGYVSTKTRARINAIIKKLDYVPNAVAQDLSLGSTHNIGVVLPHTDHPYFTQLIHGIMRAAATTNYRITLLQSRYDEELELKYLDQLRRKLFDGLIFTSHGIPLNQLSDYLSYGPIVICENPGTNRIPAVYSERTTAYNQAFRWLKARGADNLAFLFSRPETASPTTSETIRAFTHVYGRRPDAKLIIDNVISFADGYNAASRLHSGGTAPSYIFTNGDDIAAGVLQFYLKHKLVPPTLIGQENQLSGFLLHIPTINHHFVTIGAKAFQLVISDSQPDTQIAIPSDFVPGDARSYEQIS